MQNRVFAWATASLLVLPTGGAQRQPAAPRDRECWSGYIAAASFAGPSTAVHGSASSDVCEWVLGAWISCSS
jgi:hypothetical protein